VASVLEPLSFRERNDINGAVQNRFSTGLTGQSRQVANSALKVLAPERDGESNRMARVSAAVRLPNPALLSDMR
jgi:hypothetical protein